MKFLTYFLLPLGWFCYLVIFQDFASAQNQDSTSGTPATLLANESVLTNTSSYCFEFTWFGPEYDNFTRFNDTCADYLDSHRTKNVPCRPPIVITYDGSFPDIDYLWKNHKTSVLCRRSRNQVCASYAYRYNGQVNNVTYMCTKVQAVGEGPLTSGCYTQNYDGYEMELCVCESSPGYLYKPCNSAPFHINLSYLCLVLSVVAAIYQRF